jgi:magnesium transporter
MENLSVSHTTARNEIRRRIPWIFFALVAGIAMVLVGQRFEAALARRLELAFFVPMIVYMSDCIGTETLALFVRELATSKVSLRRLFWREVVVGLSLGLVTGVPMGLFAYLWRGDLGLSMALVTAMTANGVLAVLTGTITPIMFAKLGKDPALGTDEITTALSDNLSILIYFAAATLILL